MTELLDRLKHSAFVTWLLRLVNKPAPAPQPVVKQPIAPQPVSVAPPGPEPVPPTQKRPRTASRTKTQERPDTETFSDLLDGLDDSFATMAIPPIKGNWLPRKDIQALHKLGIFIPTPWQLEYLTNPTLETDLLPLAASCLMIQSKYEIKQRAVKDDLVSPRFAFALREPSLPPSVEQVRGIPYRFGYCVELTEKEHSGPPRMFWTWAWVVIRPDGELVVPNELRPTQHAITHRRNKVGAKVKGARSSSFVSRSWEKPRAFSVDHSLDATITQEQYECFLLCVFRQLILWWNDRPNHWSVGVRKEGRRVTFGIDRKHTAHYFADRDRVADCNGSNKKIIHYVREHQRVNGQTVKAHIRGLRSFAWRGYHCSVTAPNLHGSVLTTCPLPPVDDDYNGNDVLELIDVADRLSTAEDFPDLRF